MKIELGKDYTTRDGRPVRVLCVDRVGIQPVVALVRLENGEEIPLSFSSDGQFIDSSRVETDLIPVPRKFSFKRWVNVHQVAGVPVDSCGSAYNSRIAADRTATPTRIACIEITIEGREGDGL